MDNLAYAATTSNNVGEELVRTNSKIVEQLKAVQEENSRLLKIIELSVTTGCSTAVITPPSGKNRHNRQKINYEAMDALMEPEGYCWSCRYRVPRNHSSLNCDKQKPGHQLGAMHANIMGSSKAHHWWKPK
eukprot:14275973-Ditylum_brightwellii.AAC.1